MSMNHSSVVSVGALSCGHHLEMRTSLQFRQRQKSAGKISCGRILPKDCGSRLCAAPSGVRTQRKSCNASSVVASAPVALGHPAIASLPSARFAPSCGPSTARRSKLTSWTAAMRFGGVRSCERSGSSPQKIKSTEANHLSSSTRPASHSG